MTVSVGVSDYNTTHQRFYKKKDVWNDDWDVSASLHKYTSHIGTYVSRAAAIAQTNYVGANKVGVAIVKFFPAKTVLLKWWVNVLHANTRVLVFLARAERDQSEIKFSFEKTVTQLFFQACQLSTTVRMLCVSTE